MSTTDKPDAMGVRWLPPSSGVLLGVVVRSFSLDDADVSGRDNFVDGELVANVLKRDRVLEYFAGERVKPETSSLVLLAISKALVSSGVIPIGGPLIQGADASKTVEPYVPVVLCLSTLVQAWDEVLSGVRSMSASVQDKRLVLLPFLRLFSVELALRYMAYLTLVEAPSPESNPQAPWADPSGANAVIRRLLNSLPGGAPGPSELARQLGETTGYVISHQSVSKWLAADQDAEAIPKDDSLRALSEWLGPRIQQSSSSILHGLRRETGLWRLCNSIADFVGWEWVKEAATRILAYSSLAWPLVKKFGITELRASMRQTLTHGCLRTGTTGGNATLIGTISDGQVVPGPLMQLEADPVWQTDLLVVGETAKAFSMRHESAFLYAWDRRWDKFVRRIQACLQSAASLERGRSLLPGRLRALAEDALIRITSTYNRLWTPDTCVLLELAARENRHFDADLSAQIASNEEAFGQVEAAADVWPEAVSLAPEDSYKAFRYGAFLGERGNWTEAVRCLERATSLDPDWIMPRLEIARVLLYIGNTQGAFDYLATLKPDAVRQNLFGLILLREVCFQLGKWSAASTYAEELIELQPDHAEAHLVLALSKAQLAVQTADLIARKQLLLDGREAGKQARELGISDAIELFEARHTWRSSKSP